jgi:hypothetical protein
MVTYDENVFMEDVYMLDQRKQVLLFSILSEYFASVG